MKADIKVMIMASALALAIESPAYGANLAMPGLLMSQAERAEINQQRQRWLQGTPMTDVVEGELITRPADWPTSIQLTAIIRNDDRGQRFALLNHRVYQVGEQKHGLTLMAIHDQQVTVMFNGKKRQISVGEIYPVDTWPESPPSLIRVQ